MAFEASTAVHKTIQRLWDAGAIGGLTDGQLLERFLAGPEEVAEAAFAALVERHGSAVRRVCLDVLNDSHEAQDAAQAAFLVLARKARSIRKPESLGSWLHGVALRLARRARAESARRQAVEQRKAEVMAERIQSTQAPDPDRHLELHEEIERLPEKYRSPIILCYLRGHTQEQASQRLGWPLGTVQTRLHRGRERLRTRLARRGAGLSSLAAMVLAPQRQAAMAASVPASPGWVRATAIDAVRFAARKTTAEMVLVAPSAVSLAEGMLAMMVIDTLKALALIVLAASLVGSGVAVGIRAVARGREPQTDHVRPIARVAPLAVLPVNPPPRQRPDVEQAVGAGASNLVTPPALAQAEPVRGQGRGEVVVTLPARKQPDVEAAIRAGARYLKQKQQADGSWPDADSEAHTGTTSLATLALLAGDEPADDAAITRAIDYLRGFTADQLRSIYAVSLQTMVFAALANAPDRPRITRNVRWLELAQIKAGGRVNWPGSWSYNQRAVRNGDNSNTYYALLGLHAAAEAGVPVKAEVWTRAGQYWRSTQHNDGGWGYTPDRASMASSSMTCEGIASVLLTRTRSAPGQEFPEGAEVRDCGRGIDDPRLRKGIDWLTKNYRIDQNFPIGPQWRFYYLDALERVGQLGGETKIGAHDWFREGAELLVQEQDQAEGSWHGAGPVEGQDRVVTTSFALMFLGRGRSPVLIQKARHAPGDDWKNDPDDVRNLLRTIARDWKQPLNWQIVDLDSAGVDDLLRAPILFLNGHQSPVLTDRGKKALRAYVERGGFVFAEACCGRVDFDRGFRTLVAEIFPAPESPLHRLAADHPVWTARHALKPDAQALWGLEQGDRTVLIYSPADLSCGWNLRDRSPGLPATDRALQVGQNVVTYATRKPAAPR